VEDDDGEEQKVMTKVENQISPAFQQMANYCD
jgi:hypothetical protein